MVDLQSKVWPSSESEQRFQRIRTKIIRGLVQLAGAEPVRIAGPVGGLPELSDEERRGVIERTLRDLAAALGELSDVIKEWPLAEPDGSRNTDELHETMRDARETIARLLGEVRQVDAKWLKGFPEQARRPLSKLINEWSPIRKIFLAVHGIGDQFHNETVQSVAFRVCDYVGLPAALPLGRFHGGGATVTGTFLPDPDRDPPVDCGFAEIYWADVPRGPAAEQHTLEEPTKWARALVERLRLQTIRGSTLAPGRRDAMRRDDERLEQLLEELIQGVVVADRLVFLADKAGLFKFDLKKLLNDYLNDVQVVTEFEDYRKQLLAIFDLVLEKIHRYFYRSEIYIVAHSEGTVVTFMGLLKGLREGAPWTEMIRGLMTIGSPLNKHVRFWPELFDQFQPPAQGLAQPILWKNYYDYGDPIGFDLKPMRDWMARTGWHRFFRFQNPRDQDPHAPDTGDDIGFTRYLFPGEAHNEYWKDPDVFGHFIQNVVEPSEDRKEPLLRRARGEPYGVPSTVGIARLTSYVLPYVLAAALMFLASYILYKAVRGCLDPVGAEFEMPLDIAKNVAGLSLLVAGASIVARIPRLTKDRSWCWLAILSIGYLLISPANRGSIEQLLKGDLTSHPVFNGFNIGLLIALGVAIMLQLALRGLRPVLLTLIPVILYLLLLRLLGAFFFASLRPIHPSVPWSSLGVISLAWVIGITAAIISWHYPQSGTKPLVHTGGLVLLLIVGLGIWFRPSPVPYGDRVVVAKNIRELQRQAFLEIVERHPEFARLTPGEIIRLTPVEVSLLTPDEIQELNALASLRMVSEAALDLGPIWPVFLAGAAFLYLWWLAIVTFDLTFVWHLYIRFSAAQRYLAHAISPGAPPRKALESPGGQAAQSS
jgi:hypothetical protein